MKISTLQLALIVAGVLLVIGVIIYNAWQERRVKRRIAAAFNPPAEEAARSRRIEPTLGNGNGTQASITPVDTTSTVRPPSELPASPFAIPMDDVSVGPSGDLDVVPEDEAPVAVTAVATRAGAQPDPDIECVVGLSLLEPVGAPLLSSGLNARIGKRVRWFGRVHPSGPWQLVTSDVPDRYVELCACLLLADRNGALSDAQVHAFLRVVGELGAAVGATVDAPDGADEVQRAQALDKLCAELDVQIGLTVIKPDPNTVAGTRLRGVAEAAGFHLAPGGRFEHVQEDTGAVLYTLHNARSDPFTADSLRVTSTNGVVFVLDVPRVADPPRAFDQMKLAARRMAHTLGAELVDDNRRPLDDAALAKIRAQVVAAAQALSEVHIEPGSPRALALFGA
jgi:FtsZ-interacting cell division protein ZipA